MLVFQMRCHALGVHSIGPGVAPMNRRKRLDRTEGALNKGVRGWVYFVHMRFYFEGKRMGPGVNTPDLSREVPPSF